MDNTENFEAAIEIIGQAMFDYIVDRDEKGIPTDEDDKQAGEVVNRLLTLATDGYVLVQWPESQDYMEEEWFEKEAILALGSEEQTGSSAYFIPIKYVV